MAIVVEISPLNPATGTRVPLRIAAGDDAGLTGLNDVMWWPGVISSPVLRIDGWDGNFTGGASLAAAAVQIDPTALRQLDAASPAYRWAGAGMKVWQGESGAAWASWKLLFTGLVEDYGTDESGRYTFSAKVDGEPFEANVLSLTYSGSGGIEGDQNLEDKPKPMLFGRASNVEPIQIDAINNVFQVHGYGSIAAITHVYERAADLVENGGANVGNFASYAALVAATIAEGSFGTCLAQGLFRLGAPPAGLITADVDGDNATGFVRSTAEIIERLCGLASVPSDRLDFIGLGILDGQVPYPINLFVTSPTKLIDLIQSLVLACNAQAILSFTGQLRIVRFGTMPAPATTLDAQGRDLPPVLANQETRVSPPYWRIEMRGNRSWRRHSKDEVALQDLRELIESAQLSADTALTQIGYLADDGVLTIFEKISKLIPLDTELTAAWALLDDQAASRTAFAEVASARTAASTARAEWVAYRNSLSPAWNNQGAETTVVRTTFNAKLTDYRYALDALAKALRQFALISIDNIGDDNILSRFEKSKATIDWATLSADFAAVDARYVGLGSPAGLATVRNAANTNRNALSTYLTSLSPAWDNLTTDTTIVGATWRTKWNDANNALATFRAAITGLPGGSSFTLLDLSNCSSPGPSSVTKRGGGAAWNGKAKTLETGESVRVGGMLVPNAFIGLTTDPEATASFASIDYAITWGSDNTLSIYRNGAIVSSLGTRNVGLPPVRVAVEKRNGYITYHMDGFVGPVYGHAANAPSEVVCGVFALYDVGVSINGITFGVNGLDGVDGLPGTDGDDGLTYYPYYAYANSSDGSVDFTTGAPGSRAYVGFASGTSATEPLTPGSYAWTLYRGPPFGLATRGGIDVGGDQLIKLPSSPTGWNADAYSTVGFRGGASTSFRLVGPSPSVGSVMAGLNADPTLDSSYTSLDYAFYRAGNNLEMWENNVGMGNAIPPGTLTDATQLQIDYDGSAVRYLVNGVVVRTVATTADRLLYFDSSIETPGARVVDLTFGPRSAAGGSSFRLVDVANCTTGPASVTKVSGGGTWNGKARTQEGGPTVRVSGRVALDTFVGLTTDPSADSSYLSIDYGIHWSSADGNVYVFRNGTPAVIIGNRATTLPPLQVTVETTGTAVSYSIEGGAVLHSHASNAAGETLYGVFALSPQGRVVDGITFAVNGKVGENGADGFTVEASTASFLVPCDYLGNPKPGALPIPFALKVLRGATDVTASATFDASTSSSGVTVGGASGNYSLTAVGGDGGYVNMAVTYAGIALPSKRIPITKKLDQAPASSVQSSSRTWNASIAQTTYVDASASSTSAVMTCGASGVIAFSAGGTYSAGSSGGGTRSVTVEGKVQYRSTGSGSWLDASGPVTGSTAFYRPADGPDPGSISVSGNISLSAGANYEFRFIGRITTPGNVGSTGIVGGVVSVTTS